MRLKFSVVNIFKATHTREMNYSAFERSGLGRTGTCSNNIIFGFVAQGRVIKAYGVAFLYGPTNDF